MPEEEEHWYSRRRLSEEGRQAAEAANRFLLEAGNRWAEEPHAPTRVVVDTSVLVGPKRNAVAAAAVLGYYWGYWSSWIVSEFLRVWLELAALKIGPSAGSAEEAVVRLQRTWGRARAVVDDLLEVFTSVDYRIAPEANLSWLKDRDDLAVMRTALAAGADILVSDNSKDFPLGETRCGVYLLSADRFLDFLYLTYPEAEAEVTEYLRRRGQA